MSSPYKTADFAGLKTTVFDLIGMKEPERLIPQKEKGVKMINIKKTIMGSILMAAIVVGTASWAASTPTCSNNQLFFFA